MRVSLLSVVFSLSGPDALPSRSWSASCSSVHWIGLLRGSVGAKEGLLHWALFSATGPAMASRGKLCSRLTQTNFLSIDLFIFCLSCTFETLQSYRKPTCAEIAKGTDQSVNDIQTKRVNQTIKQNRY